MTIIMMIVQSAPIAAAKALPMAVHGIGNATRMTSARAYVFVNVHALGATLRNTPMRARRLEKF